MPSPDEPQPSPDVLAQLEAVDKASTQPPAAFMREMGAVPTAVFPVIDTTTEEAPWWSDYTAAAIEAGTITAVAVRTESKGDDTDFPQGPPLSAERLAQVRVFAKATGDRLRAQHEAMEARPALVGFPMEFPFSLQRNTLVGPPVVTFIGCRVRQGNGVLTYRILDAEKKELLELERIFTEGQTITPQKKGNLEYSITYREGVFYYTGPDLRTIQILR